MRGVESEMTNQEESVCVFNLGDDNLAQCVCVCVQVSVDFSRVLL